MQTLQSYIEPAHELTLSKHCGYSIHQSRILINVPAISNNRVQGNVSGTLSLELWALRQPYAGGNFAGEAVAGTQIGEIFGQYHLANGHYDLAFQEPSAGVWHLCLMLREWTADGFQTRDFVNFDIPYHVQWKPVLVETSAENVVAIEVAREKKAKQVAPGAAEKSKADSRDKAAPLAAAKTRKADKSAAAKQDTRISVNKASAQELAEIKGLTQKVVAQLIERRPFAKLDDLLELKGMGEKLLEKIRAQIKL